MLTNRLQHLGYSEKEAKIYLALLELGTSPASTIARFIGENRVTVYSTLKILTKKGITFESQKNGIQVYTGINPEILIAQEKSKYETLSASLPEFLTLINTHSTKPKVTFYDGIEGMKNLIREVIRAFAKNPHEKIHGFLGAKGMDKRFEEFLRNSLEVEKTKPKETPTNIIVIGESSYWYADYCRKHYNTKTVTELEIAMEHELFTYGNTVIMLMYSSSELSGIMIESKTLAGGIRSMFELIWKYAPESK